MPPDRLADLEAAFREAYPRQLPFLERLLAALKNDGQAVAADAVEGGLWKGANAVAGRARLLNQVHERGLTVVLGRRKSADSQAAIVQLVEDFIHLGARAVISVGSGRAGDFLNNQLRGRWAEEVVVSLGLPGLTIVPFGPSGAAMPGDEDHRSVVSTFAAISLLEGKRPDLLGFDSTLFAGLSPAERERIGSWPTRLLEAEDDALIRRASCALEVKSSLWHYGQRRKNAGYGRPLSITLKEEEIAAIQQWQDRTGVPVLFVQVLFDEMYCMSFSRMRDAIQRGFLYKNGDLDEGRDRKTTKATYQFQLADLRHLLAEVVFPAESAAVIKVLTDGSVVPHIRYAPAAARNEKPEVLRTEMRFGR